MTPFVNIQIVRQFIDSDDFVLGDPILHLSKGFSHVFNGWGRKVTWEVASAWESSENASLDISA